MAIAKEGSRVILFSRNGHDFSERFPAIVQELRELPAKAAMLDGEIVVSDVDGHPNFARLHLSHWAKPGPAAVHLWAFDLLVFNGRDLRQQPLVRRQECLQVLLERFGCPAVSVSEPFGMDAGLETFNQFDITSLPPSWQRRLTPNR